MQIDNALFSLSVWNGEFANYFSEVGAAYVEDISYNKANNLPSEYEVLLQRSVEYRIIEVQKFKGKYIIVAEVL